jgi:hypothetical protein
VLCKTFQNAAASSSSSFSQIGWRFGLLNPYSISSCLILRDSRNFESTQIKLLMPLLDFTKLDTEGNADIGKGCRFGIYWITHAVSRTGREI